MTIWLIFFILIVTRYYILGEKMFGHDILYVKFGRVIEGNSSKEIGFDSISEGI